MNQLDFTFKGSIKFQGTGLDKWNVVRVTNNRMTDAFKSCGVTSCNKRKILDTWGLGLRSTAMGLPGTPTAGALTAVLAAMAAFTALVMMEAAAGLAAAIDGLDAEWPLGAGDDDEGAGGGGGGDAWPGAPALEFLGWAAARLAAAAPAAKSTNVVEWADRLRPRHAALCASLAGPRRGSGPWPRCRTGAVDRSVRCRNDHGSIRPRRWR